MTLVRVCTFMIGCALLCSCNNAQVKLSGLLSQGFEGGIQPIPGYSISAPTSATLTGGAYVMNARVDGFQKSVLTGGGITMTAGVVR